MSVALWAVSADRSAIHLHSSTTSGATSFISWATRRHYAAPQELLGALDFKEVMGCLAVKRAQGDVFVCHSVAYDVELCVGSDVCRMYGGRHKFAGSAQGLHSQWCLGLRAMGLQVAVAG